MNIKKILYIVLGTIGLILGAIGVVLPLLPAFPFLLLATVCYAKSSKKLHTWFINTKLYKNNLDSYVKGKGMSWSTKFRIIIMVTILMSIGFVMMITQKIYYGCFLLSVIWIFHLVYFIFRVKTVPLE